MKNYKNILFGLLLLTLFFPIIEQGLRITHFAHKLGGVVEKLEEVKPSIQSILSLEFQNYREKQIKNDLYIQGFLVRFNNQLKYWIFNKLKANGAVEGKDGYLFFSNYIDEVNGYNFVGDSTIKAYLTEINTLKDSLKNHNIPFIFIISPNKARVYKDKIPSNYKNKFEDTNYKFFLKKLDSLKINYIDFNEIFLSQKSKANYPLFARGANHWSDYGSFLALDSILKSVNKMTKKTIINYYKSDSTISISPKKEDKDIANLNNLLFIDNVFYNEEKIYYTLEVDSSKSKYKPNLLFISDSFYWSFYNNNVQRKLFDSKSKFWYYNSSIWPNSESNNTNPIKNVEQITNMKSELYERDLVIFMITEGNLHSCCWNIKDKILEKL